MKLNLQSKLNVEDKLITDTVFNIHIVTKKMTGVSELNMAMEQLVVDYLYTKQFMLKTQISEFETKWNLTYHEFEKESANWENGFSYEIEQEYYEWGALVSELEYFEKIGKDEFE